jgi:hypothetical protein
LLHELAGHEHNVNTATFSLAGDTLFTADAGGVLKMWGPDFGDAAYGGDDRKVRCSLGGHEHFMHSRI